MRLTKLPLLITLWATAFICHAEVAEINEYDIEIVIFEDLSSRYVNSEQWPRSGRHLPDEPLVNVVDTDSAIETPNSGDNDVINILSNESRMLDAHVKTLNDSARYNVLVHKSWRQTGLSEQSAINIPINSEDTSKDASATEFTNFNTGLGNTNGEKSTSSISGDIKVTLGRYLHIYTDLIYKRPNVSRSPVLASSINEPFKKFSIKSHRRMRSKELHYIDHPLVGILVMALPVEKQEEAIEEELPEKEQAQSKQ